MDARGALTGLHVLVVEDNADASAILTAVLEYCGAFVTQKTTATDALRFLRQATPDAVVADMHLPDHDARWLVREAQRLRTMAPVILVSAADFDPEELEARGFAIFLRKPLDLPRLVDAVLAVVRRR
jgi:DNA-binding response OmpR family regulator